MTTREDEMYERCLPQGGEKLGGWPSRGREMEVLLQIDSHDNLPILFGDMGTGHVTICPEHADVLALAWAC